ncbi:nuclease-related domain-containing DEAD/DEAH box helicase [Burkholderia cenocepacia]|uniref:nuclease-related domain-containing DEAD/DEAH box helicase n=1 Tax=Burkholderia cenocepacia TaxID=95486 RepID=UPI00285CDF3D|nr:NERD domain-containing protein [Burkholderia cenocepacia]MDR8070248.1 NERD domain-containing protein [Burkholderia cenocepacia]
MAIMIPDVTPDQIIHGSERDVYVALRDQLPDTYRVVHSLPWLRPERDSIDAPLREGEADFVIFHPSYGLLVLEVKGGQEMFARGPHWFRRLAKGERKITNPFEQARRNMHALTNAVEERTGGRITPNKYVYGYAVVFPQGRATGVLPLDVDDKILIDVDRMHELERLIEKAFESFPRKVHKLERAEFIEMLDVLLPRFQIMRPLSPQIEAGREKLLQLTDNQALAFRGLFANQQLLVEGVAGSGKTLLAIERALAFARQGVRCLFVCYNKELAQWLREQLAADPSRAEIAALVDVYNFHSLAAELAKEAGLPFDVPADQVSARQFWDEGAVAVLEAAVASLFAIDEPRYGALVVDEAQDFAELWWYALFPLIKGGEGGPIFVFMDLAQSLRAEAGPPPFEFSARYSLNVNCRNTKRIARLSSNLVSLETLSPVGAPEGIDVRMLRATVSTQQSGLVANELRRLLDVEKLVPNQIVLIGPASKERGSLRGLNEVSGAPIVTSAADWRNQKGILCTTARSFKGLEADVVVVYDLAALSPIFTSSDLYVACSRARHVLILVTHDDRIRSIIENAEAASRIDA